jgi:hypothetical protein
VTPALAHCFCGRFNAKRDSFTVVHGRREGLACLACVRKELSALAQAVLYSSATS